MQWKVSALPAAQAELDALPVGLRARLYRLLAMIEAYGLEQVHAPHVRHLEGKLWELRAKAAEGIARGVYVTAEGRKIVVLHVFEKKSEKTPRQAPALARRRMEEID